MQIEILFFGLVAEKIKEQSVVLVFEDQKLTVGFILDTLNKKYLQLNQLDFQIAVNQELAQKDKIIITDSTIALLPPFAGG